MTTSYNLFLYSIVTFAEWMNNKSMVKLKMIIQLKKKSSGHQTSALGLQNKDGCKTREQLFSHNIPPNSNIIKLELAKYYNDSKMTAFISERSRNSK